MGVNNLLGKSFAARRRVLGRLAKCRRVAWVCARSGPSQTYIISVERAAWHVEKLPRVAFTQLCRAVAPPSTAVGRSVVTLGLNYACGYSSPRRRLLWRELCICV